MLLRNDYWAFQSTLPARGSDGGGGAGGGVQDVSIHAPREGERRVPKSWLSVALPVSIHAPREGERHESSVS